MPDHPRPWAIEPLGKHHDRAAFSCGAEALDAYLRKRAGQEQRKNIARVFVAEGGEPHVIAGYYTLSGFGIDVGDLPEPEAKRLPRYPIVPAALIGRLAVDRRFQGMGLGGILLIDALARILQAGGEVASYAAVVDAKDDSAVAFYRKYGFIPFPSRPNRLFLPVATAKAAIFG